MLDVEIWDSSLVLLASTWATVKAFVMAWTLPSRLCLFFLS